MSVMHFSSLMGRVAMGVSKRVFKLPYATRWCSKKVYDSQSGKYIQIAREEMIFDFSLLHHKYEDNGELKLTEQRDNVTVIVPSNVSDKLIDRLIKEKYTSIIAQVNTTKEIEKLVGKKKELHSVYLELSVDFSENYLSINGAQELATRAKDCGLGVVGGIACSFHDYTEVIAAENLIAHLADIECGNIIINQVKNDDSGDVDEEVLLQLCENAINLDVDGDPLKERLVFHGSEELVRFAYEECNIKHFGVNNVKNGDNSVTASELKDIVK